MPLLFCPLKTQSKSQNLLEPIHASYMRARKDPKYAQRRKARSITRKEEDKRTKPKEGER